MASTRQSTLLPYLVALAALVSLVGLFLWHRNIRLNLEQELESAAFDLKQSRDFTTDMRIERDSLRHQLQIIEDETSESKGMTISLEARNRQLAREIAEVRTINQAHDRTIGRLNSEAARLKRELIDVKTAAPLSERDYQAQVTRYEEAIEGLNLRIYTLENELSSRPVAEKGPPPPDPEEIAPPNLKGAVVQVGPGSSFVVLNIGTDDGAVEGLLMFLRRRERTVARVQLTDVRLGYTIAHILPDSPTGTIRVGDVAAR
ncbi:MAG: hypothetical protein DRP71_09105 [Verrucomicrobia bacterium]|nr:MAG: hypothetical protein DRP71_09105 [Verrucomicrobiota bacterium]